MITVASTAGKLVEVRIQTPITAAELADMKAASVAIFSRLRIPFAGITDLRAARVLPAELADQVTAFLKRDAPNVMRSAFLVGEGAIFNMQLDRVLREAASERRRSFRTRAELLAWMGEVLTPEEQRRLTSFLDEGETLASRA